MEAALPQEHYVDPGMFAHEREMLGLYVSDHPLAGQEALLMRHSDMGTIALKESEIKDGESVTLAGLITQVQHKVARASGNPYGQVVLEDFSGEVSIMFMGKTYLENRELLKADQTVSIRGRVQRRDEEVMLSAYSIDVLEAGREQGGGRWRTDGWAVQGVCRGEGSAGPVGHGLGVQGCTRTGRAHGF